MQLKSKLKLYEEFTRDLLNESADATSHTDVAIDKSTPAETIRTEVIRDVDTILNNLIELSDRVSESTSISLEIDELYEELYDLTNTTLLNEGIIDIIKSPIKYMKISKNLKMYQKALIQQSINDVDYAKKKEASKEDPNPKAAEVLKQANLAKNKALKDQVDAINDRMTELSKGDEGLSKVVTMGKNKSKLQAAKVVMKATSGEEAKALKLEISTLEDRVADDEQSLKDYAAKQEPKEKSQAEIDAEDAEAKAKSDAQLGYNENAELDGSGRLSSIVNEEAEEVEVEVEVNVEAEEEKEEDAEAADKVEGEEAAEVVVEEEGEEVEEAEEAPEEEVEESTKAKIYEGMSIAERFKALM